MSSFPRPRPRRVRKNELVRKLVRETTLNVSQLVQPYFVVEEKNAQEPISGFTGIFRWGIDTVSKKIEVDLDRGVKNILLFGEIPEAKKDELGSHSFSSEALIPETLRALRSRFGDSLLLFTDVCLCPATSHGHCGVVVDNRVENDSSLEYLGKMALVHAQAGADFVAPSDMMDGRVGYLRRLLDTKGYLDVGILAYTAKYASSYYGPFREALGSSPKSTDRATYQMDFANRSEALRELELDLAEGADLVMVKPALAYLDIISAFRQHSNVPVVAYSVSGEYEMVKRLAQAKMVDEKKMAIENLSAIARAGAQVVISYYTSEIVEKGWLE